ncbi:phage prohead protease, HK97 family [Brevundimonas vesicularis]|uniref:Phage prohead protease, HK97 family n=1 Tax=Brevundimonas vesicularis TaxID=41276 RepID=A0A2X1B509_BREVE|nr:phage prohead protease, HK97 family [Brevundimonas vesicularis]
MSGARSFLPPRSGEGGRGATGWGRPGKAALLETKEVGGTSPGRPHPVSPDGSTTLPRGGREKSGALVIEGYASLWGAADLNGDVVQAGAFADSLAKTGAEGVRMLNQHDARAPVGVWEQIVEDARGLFVRGRIEDWSAEARFAGALSRAGALDGLSIGYRTARARRQGRLRVLSAVELWEVSLVTFPMLPGARFSLA